MHKICEKLNKAGRDSMPLQIHVDRSFWVSYYSLTACEMVCFCWKVGEIHFIEGNEIAPFCMIIHTINWCIEASKLKAMKTREDYDEDMQVLWHIMEKGAKNNKKSVDVMLVKIRELNNGSFIGSLPCSFWSVTVRFPQVQHPRIHFAR